MRKRRRGKGHILGRKPWSHIAVWACSWSRGTIPAGAEGCPGQAVALGDVDEAEEVKGILGGATRPRRGEGEQDRKKIICTTMGCILFEAIDRAILWFWANNAQLHFWNNLSKKKPATAKLRPAGSTDFFRRLSTDRAGEKLAIGSQV